MCLLVGSVISFAALSIVCIVSGYFGAGFVFGVISGLIPIGVVATADERARDKAETEEREQVRTENLLRPKVAWWSPEPIPAGSR